MINTQQEGKDEKIRFNVNSVEVELETVVEKEVGGTGSGKIRFWVIDVDAEVNSKYKNAAKQKIKLSLEAVDVFQNPDGTTKTVRSQIHDEAN